MGMIGNTLAQGLISGANIVDGTVDTPDIKDSAITTAKIGSGAVTVAKLSTGAPTWDSAGNFGLGATPSTWTVFKAFEIGAAGTGLAGAAGQPVLFSNAYYNGGWRYAANGVAANYDQSSGAHRWFNAASGTAGSFITFTQGMTFNSVGNLLIGGTTDYGSGRLIIVQSANDKGLAVIDSAASYTSYLYSNSTASVLGNNDTKPFIFQVNGTERARFNPSGQFGVATTTPFATIAANTPNRTDGNTNSLGAIIAAGSISDSPTHSFASSTAIFRVHGSNATNNLQFGVGGNGYNYHPWIQASYDNSTPGSPNSGAKELILQPIGGNVLIGQTSSSHASFRLESSNSGSSGAKIGIVSLGRSGGDYPYIGYNFAFTGTSGSYVYAGTDFASSIYFYVGGIYTYTANSGTAGNAISYTGGPYVARGGTSWTNASDERLKNITGEIQNGLAKVLALQAATYTWKSDEQNIPQVGLIAQNVLTVVPEAVVVPEEEFNGKPETSMGVNYDRLIPVLVKAIQEQQAIITSLTERITALEAA